MSQPDINHEEFEKETRERIKKLTGDVDPETLTEEEFHARLIMHYGNPDRDYD